ncbi:hypothetical protein SAY87_008844 [Trapa incisa]|uniref:Uncharacterized protein n=1 Tax=Trapa incisa TaxID=236973 RepID=A0AAN7PVR3_9MYRT|nr:hypothetical protein SAY87_008844 [Trapa incisa]
MERGSPSSCSNGGTGSTPCMVMMGGGGGGSYGGAGDNSGGVLCPMMIMTNYSTSSSSTASLATATHNLHNPNSSINHHQHHSYGHLLPLPPPPPPPPSAARGSNSMEIDGSGSSSSLSPAKAKIMAHPHFPRLLAAYVNCHKVGAPPEVMAKLEEAYSAAVTMGGGNAGGCVGEDPVLDQFMEAYCEMLIKYEQELSKPFKEAMHFLQKMESQLEALTLNTSEPVFSDGMDMNVSSEEEGDVNRNFIDPQAEDRELKRQLLQKYSGYLGSLKQEFMKKRKKGKLPKEARQQLLDWWTRHYKWPYPSESQKLALAESTGLDQKQINNWFINQRKRHWKPSEDMQFVVMDAAHPHYYYMDNILGNPFPMDTSPNSIL